MKFCARLPVLLREQYKLKRVPLKQFRLLPENRRVEYSSWLGSHKWYEKVFLAPFPNPVVEKLRRKLKKQKFKYRERIEADSNGVEYCIIEGEPHA